jgi:prepilin-type N-terminal cleavage/methylation domain-containing protein
MDKKLSVIGSTDPLHETNTAFTLIELLVVIAIIGLLTTIGIVSFSSSRTKARAARAAGDLRQIAQALNLYFDANGVYPCFDHLWDDTWETTWSAPYMKWPKNPWGGQYHWENSQQGLTFSISMSGLGLENAQIMDKYLDDGNPATGIIRIRLADGRLEYGGMDQSIPLIDCSPP